MALSVPRIKIPMINGTDSAEFFPDELPGDANDVIDVLRSELAPFRTEYRRQGMEHAFDAILTEIVNALEDSTVDKIFREREDYAEGLTEIYVALAAKAMCDLTELRRTRKLTAEEDTQHVKKVVENLKQADEKLRLNEYTWLIKGFFELMVHNDVKRAEDHFKAVHDRATKGQNQLKKKFLFGSLLGLGMVSYARQRYQIALDHFSKAILANPACGGTVRMAVVCCCFKLEQYDRAKLAVDKALSMEPTNANIIVAKALLDVVTSSKLQKERSAKHSEQIRKQTYDYCNLALKLDNNNALALNLLANHHFHNWVTVNFVDGCYLVEGKHLLLPKKAVTGMTAGDKLLLTFSSSSSGTNSNGKAAASNAPWTIDGFVQDLKYSQEVVEGVCGHLLTGSSSQRVWSDFLVIQVSAPSETSREAGVAKVDSLQWKDLQSCVKHATLTLGCCNLSAVRAESHYILGKVHHLKGELNAAFDCYWRALKESPELSLAAFGAAQIYFSRSEFAAAQELFEKVLAKSPDDKDTQAYVMLLKAMNKQISTPIEKLREIAPGFKFEIDLWLLQGQLRQKQFSEYPTALKCYQAALECIEQAYGVERVPPVLYSNIGVLQHALGKPEKALESCKRTLVAISAHHSAENAEVEVGVIHNNAEFEGIFYKWGEQPLCRVTLGEADSFELTQDGASSLDLTLHLNVGDEVVIGDVKHTVRNVTTSSIVAYSPVKLASLQNNIPAATAPSSFPVFVKKIFGNFNDQTVTFCYNFARVLEDCGRTKAASELYVELLKRHPSFMECYLRQSLISSDAGKTSEATTWLNRALEVSNDQPDATICLGDLHLKSDHGGEAKKCYDKICVTSRHDARSMLSLGNFYFATGKAETRLKDSYKFFYHVLNEDPSNIFAANGLAMVCAEKRELDAAKDIFAKAREANKSEDVGVNLAHVFMSQNRIVDAERLYQATYNNLLRNAGNETIAAKSANLTECVSFAQYRQNRFDDALKSIQKAIHMRPNDLKLWYNLAIVLKQSAASVAKKSQKTSAEIQDARVDLDQAHGVLKYVKKYLDAKGKISSLTAEGVQRIIEYCLDKNQVLKSQLSSVQREEESRREERQKQQAEHEMRLRQKLEEKEQQERAAEAEKREKQLLAAQKQAKLAELQEKWVVATEASQSAKSKREAGAAGAGKRKRKDKTEEDEILAGLDDSDEEDDIRPIQLSQQQQQKQSKNSSKSSAAAAAAAAPKKMVIPRAPEGEVDFGSSSDEDEAGAAPKKTQLDIDLFGEDSDDEAAAAAAARKRKNNSGESEEGGGMKRKRLSKQGGGGAAEGSDSDEFTEEHEAGASAVAGEVATSSSSKRLTVDSDDE